MHICIHTNQGLSVFLTVFLIKKTIGFFGLFGFFNIIKADFINMVLYG